MVWQLVANSVLMRIFPEESREEGIGYYWEKFVPHYRRQHSRRRGVRDREL